jgi:dCTP diphosphatase
MSDIKRMTEIARTFRDERDWKQFHDHKSMAMSLAIEAAEVMEHFQWLKEDQLDAYVAEHKEDIGDELADVTFYLLELADNLGIDLSDAFERKVAKSAAKYPVEKAKGVATKYTRL